jgi:hypothetical protein
LDNFENKVPKTAPKRITMNFVSKGQPLTRAGLTKVLGMLGLGPNDSAYIWTVVEVETAGITQGFGFRVDHRPQILFERHIFRNTRTAVSIVKRRTSPALLAAMDCSPSNTTSWKKLSRFAPRQS